MLAEKGQFDIGFVDVLEFVERENKAIMIIHYLPQSGAEKQRVLLTLLLEGQKRDWTEGTLASFIEDAKTHINQVEIVKFNSFDNLKYMDTQIFVIQNLDNFEYLNHGDVGFFD